MAQVRDTTLALAPITLDRLHASGRGVNAGGQSGIHLDESPWLNGPKHRADRRHQRGEFVQPIGRSNQDHHGHLEPMEVLLVSEVLVGGEEHRKVLCGEQPQSFAMPFACAPHLDHRADLMAMEFPSQRSGHTLVK